MTAQWKFSPACLWRMQNLSTGELFGPPRSKSNARTRTRHDFKKYLLNDELSRENGSACIHVFQKAMSWNGTKMGIRQEKRASGEKEKAMESRREGVQRARLRSLWTG